MAAVRFLYADLLVLGCGEKMLPSPPRVQDWLASHGIALECLSTVSSSFKIIFDQINANLIICPLRFIPPTAWKPEVVSLNTLVLSDVTIGLQASASSTFNILNQEGRAVVGALLPCD